MHITQVMVGVHLHVRTADYTKIIQVSKNYTSTIDQKGVLLVIQTTYCVETAKEHPQRWMSGEELGAQDREEAFGVIVGPSVEAEHRQPVGWHPPPLPLHVGLQALNRLMDGCRLENNSMRAKLLISWTWETMRYMG